MEIIIAVVTVSFYSYEQSVSATDELQQNKEHKSTKNLYE